MRRGAVVAFACLFCATPVVASADVDEVVPKAKPLQGVSQDQFLEGVDLPPAKPRELDPKTVPVTTGNDPDTSCEIPHALLEASGPVNGTLEGDPGCEIRNPVLFAGVARGGVELTFPAPAGLSCRFARVLSEWLVEDVLPAAESHLGRSGGLMRTGPGYQCRRRNNQPDGKLSEHALGKAIDLSGFAFDAGLEVSVEKDWSSTSAKGRFLKAIHASACKRFTTVLGPEADANHRSHFHLDIGCHGKTCTYLICQ